MLCGPEINKSIFCYISIYKSLNVDYSIMAKETLDINNVLRSDLHRMVWRKLAIFDAAERLNDLRVPLGNRL
jgi:plasmid maintenance system killer protein